MKKIFYVLILLNFNFIHVFSVEPDVFVQSTVNRASEILAKNISQEEKINKLKLIAKETVDIQGVGFYSLGSARKNLSEEEKIKYLQLFEDYFLKVFLVGYQNIQIQKLMSCQKRF